MRKTFNDLIDAILPEITEVYPWDLVDELERENDVLLLDVRQVSEFNDMHIPGSLNVPRGILETACDYGYEETTPELVEARQRRVVIVCRSGNRSALAAYTLQQMGFENVVNLKLGLRGWNDEEQRLQNADGETVPFEESDDYFIPRLTEEQMGKAA